MLTDSTTASGEYLCMTVAAELASADFLRWSRKSLPVRALQGATGIVEFCSGGCASSEWANCHSALGEMTQVPLRQNSRARKGSKMENGRNIPVAAYSITLSDSSLGPASRGLVIANPAHARNPRPTAASLCDMPHRTTCCISHQKANWLFFSRL